MKIQFNKGIGIVAVSILLAASSFISLTKTQTEYAVDLVCGMKVNKSEAYVWKYHGKKYFFDSYNCKKTFKMTPEKFLNNKCIPPNDTLKKK